MINKFPFYTQNEAMDCGPACLRMVAKYYGHHYSLQTLRKKCFITREGVSLLGISDAAENIGFHTNGVRISLQKFANEAPLPCILHWNQNHFVVCYNVRRNRKGSLQFQIADPASQLLNYNQQEFSAFPMRVQQHSHIQYRHQEKGNDWKLQTARGGFMQRKTKSLRP